MKSETTKRSAVWQMIKFTLFAGLLTAACALYGSFEVKEGTLTVKSKDMTLETRDGMIQSLRMANGEQFCKESSAFPDAPFRRSLPPDSARPHARGLRHRPRLV